MGKISALSHQPLNGLKEQVSSTFGRLEPNLLDTLQKVQETYIQTTSES